MGSEASTFLDSYCSFLFAQIAEMRELSVVENQICLENTALRTLWYQIVQMELTIEKIRIITRGCGHRDPARPKPARHRGPVAVRLL